MGDGDNYLPQKIEYVIKQSQNKPLYIFISHEHQDHFDKETLKHLDEVIKEIIIVEYENKNFYNDLKNHVSTKIVEKKSHKSFHIEDTEICLLKEESGNNRDCAIYFKNGEKSFLNYNDCKIFDSVSLIKELLGPIDLISGQFSGAVMHPHSYFYDEKYETKIAQTKKRAKFINIAKFVKSLGAKCFIPSAGPPLLLGENLEKINFRENTIFPKNYEFYSWWSNSNAMKGVLFFELENFESISMNNMPTLSKCKKIPKKTITKYINSHKDNIEEISVLQKKKLVIIYLKFFMKKLLLWEN